MEIYVRLPRGVKLVASTGDSPGGAPRYTALANQPLYPGTYLDTEDSGGGGGGGQVQEISGVKERLRESDVSTLNFFSFISFVGLVSDECDM